MPEGEAHHECGFAILRLLKPPEFYMQKYGTCFYGLNRMYLLLEKQRNRGQDGCGVASVRLDVAPGVRYIDCERSIAKDCIKDLFADIEANNREMVKGAPTKTLPPFDEKGKPWDAPDPAWLKQNVPFTGEMFLGHVRYGTDSGNSVDKCHPVRRESNWMTRNLCLAGNFNITNNEVLFKSLVDIGQHPREMSDTVTLLEKIGHFVDKENNDLYVKFSAEGHNPRTCFAKIADAIDIAAVLRRASGDWDGGYAISGMLGHGDMFTVRDPNGIRPAYYFANDEIVCVASERPLIQSVFKVHDGVNELPPGHALVVKRTGKWSIHKINEPRDITRCSFERIYFSRGNDADVYKERQRLGAALCHPTLALLKKSGHNLNNAVLSYVPNTSEIAFYGLVKEFNVIVDRMQEEAVEEVLAGNTPQAIQKVKEMMALRVRVEKVVHKDAKMRTFIQEDSSRESLTVHAYDLHYGTVEPHKDVLVALDDSIVRGNTLKNNILTTLDRLQPVKIIVVSSAPQIRYPDPYGLRNK